MMSRFPSRTSTQTYVRRFWPGAAGVALLLMGTLLKDSVGLDVATAWMLSSLLVVGWTTFCGPAQEVSLGHALFFGGAGYVAALLQTRAGIGPIPSLIGAAAVTAAAGAALALLTARHRGLYFSMVTMAVQIAIYRVLFLRGDLFGGEEGLTGIRVAVESRIGLFVAAGALLIASGMAAAAFLRSNTGLLLGAVGQHETLASSLGVRLAGLRAAGLAVSAASAGMGGAVWALTQGYINPELASEELSARAALLGCIGGLWSVPGALVASLGWEAFRFGLSRVSTLSGPISAALLLGLVARPSRNAAQSRPTWDDLPIRSSTPRRADDADGGSGLTVRGLSVRFGGLHPLRDVTFSLNRGRATGLIGPNGAGKSTLLNAVAGLVPSTGAIEWDGQSLVRFDTAERARRGVRKTFQHPARFPDLSAWEHLQVAMAAASSIPLQGAALRTLLEMCEPTRGRPAGDMDAGTLRMMEMAMTLVAPPRMLLLDEPFAGLSARQADAVSDAITELKAAGVTLLIVEHRLVDMLRSIDDLVVLADGHVVRSGPAASVLADPDVRSVYLGG